LKFLHNAYYYLDRLLRPLNIAFFSFLAAKSFGPGIFSDICYVQLILSFFIPLSTLGLEGVVKRKASKKSKDYLSFTALSMVSRIIITTFLLVIFFIFSNYLNIDFDKAYYVLLGFNLFLSCTDVVEWMFFGLKKFNEISKIRFLCSIFFTPLRFISIYLGPIYYLLSICFESLLVATFFLKAYKLKFVMLLSSKFKFIFSKESLWYMLSGLLVVVFSKLDQILLVAQFGKLNLAYYSIPIMIIGFSSSFILTLMNPQLMKLLNAKQNQFDNYSLAAFASCLKINLRLILLIIPIAFFIPVILGATYNESTAILLILSINILINTITSIHSVYWLSICNSRSVMLLTIFSSISTLILCYTFSNWLGLKGLAIGSVLSNILGNFLFPFFVQDGKKLMYLTYKHFFKINLL
jgi:O-antigen/teichoic acid export membrane protein